MVAHCHLIQDTGLAWCIWQIQLNPAWSPELKKKKSVLIFCLTQSQHILSASDKGGLHISISGDHAKSVLQKRYNIVWCSHYLFGRSQRHWDLSCLASRFTSLCPWCKLSSLTVGWFRTAWPVKIIKLTISSPFAHSWLPCADWEAGVI